MRYVIERVIAIQSPETLCIYRENEKGVYTQETILSTFSYHDGIYK
jgi:hypothetical protein